MRIVFSTKWRRPGCVLMQAALGGTVPGALFHALFPSETWIAGGERECPGATSDLQVFNATEDQLRQLSRMAAAATAEQLKALEA